MGCCDTSLYQNCGLTLKISRENEDIFKLVPQLKGLLERGGNSWQILPTVLAITLKDTVHIEEELLMEWFRKLCIHHTKGSIAKVPAQV